MVTINLGGTLEGMVILGDVLYLYIAEDDRHRISVMITDFNIQYATKSLPTTTSMEDNLSAIVREVEEFLEFNKHSEMIFKIEHSESTTKAILRRSGIPAINLCIAGFGGKLNVREIEMEEDYE